MRMGVVIVALAAIAVTLVHIRRMEIAARHQTQDLRTCQVKLRRKLWDQQIRLGFLTSPDEVRRRADEMSLDLIEKEEANRRTADRSGVQSPLRR